MGQYASIHWPFGPEREVECEGDDHALDPMRETTHVVGEESGVVTRKERVVVNGVVRERLICARKEEGWATSLFPV
jgi:hypothetical protein